MSTPKKPATTNDKPRLLFTGLSMGLADLIPGVSSGTIAFLYGIYDELLFSIKQATGAFPRLIFKGQFKQALAVIPFGFLIPVIGGMLIAIFSLSHLVTYLLENHATYVWSFFFGLVLGSVFLISKRVTHWNINRVLMLLLGAFITYYIVGLAGVSFEPTPLAIFLTGMIAFCAMILPGISGSLIMVILGQYKHVIEAINDLNFTILASLAAGGAVGLALFSRLLSWLLRDYHGAVIAFLIGMMIGSLRKVWPWQEGVDTSAVTNVLPSFGLELLASISLMLLAIFIVWRLEKLGIASEHDDIHTKDFEHELAEQKNQ